MKVHTVNSNSQTSTANVTYFQSKIQLSGFSAYPDLLAVPINPGERSSTVLVIPDKWSSIVLVTPDKWSSTVLVTPDKWSSTVLVTPEKWSSTVLVS
jgi:hypothetical protein